MEKTNVNPQGHEGQCKSKLSETFMNFRHDHGTHTEMLFVLCEYVTCNLCVYQRYSLYDYSGVFLEWYVFICELFCPISTNIYIFH